MRKINELIIHNNGVPGRTIKNIRRSHKARGFSDVGYHYVILENGTIQRGRPEHKQGAHTKGANRHSIGICVIGNGNEQDFSPTQYVALAILLLMLLDAYPGAEIRGHREAANRLAKRYHTSKQCPGTKVSMDAIRATVVDGSHLGWVAV